MCLSDLSCPRSGRVPRFCTRCGGGLSLSDVPRDQRQRLRCSDCQHIHYLDPKVAAGVVCAMDGGVVLVRRAIEPGRGKWVVPGGFMEHDETVEEAAVRETLEETGLEVELDGLLGVYSYRRSVVVLVVYRARPVGGCLRALDECLEARVFGPAEIPWDQLAFVTSRDALLDYIRAQDQ